MPQPPKKRKRDSQEPSNSVEGTTNPPPERSDCLYFKDGNIVLIAQDNAFRVHKSVLALHSDVFRNMFDDVNEPEGAEVFDGCSVVRLSDENKALDTFLKTLYMIEPISQPADPASYFQDVLELATKYLCNTIRRQALDAFRCKYFPDTLADWDTRDDSLDAVFVIRLARDIKADILLPAAFYALFQYDPDIGDVAKKDIVKFCEGGRKLGAFWPKFLQNQIVHHEEPPCKHLHCRKSWRTFSEMKTLEVLENGQTAEMDTLLQFKKCSKDFKAVEGVCWESKATIRRLCDAKRVEIWNLRDDHVELSHSFLFLLVTKSDQNT